MFEGIPGAATAAKLDGETHGLIFRGAIKLKYMSPGLELTKVRDIQPIKLRYEINQTDVSAPDQEGIGCYPV